MLVGERKFLFVCEAKAVLRFAPSMINAWRLSSCSPFLIRFYDPQHKTAFALFQLFSLFHKIILTPPMADTPPVPPAGSSSVTPPAPPDAVQTVTEGIANIAASAPNAPNFSFNFEPNTGPLGQASPNVVEDDEEYDEEDEGDMPPEMIRRVVYLQDQHEAKMKIQEVSAANTRVVDKSVITR